MKPVSQRFLRFTEASLLPFLWSFCSAIPKSLAATLLFLMKCYEYAFFFKLRDNFFVHKDSIAT